MTVTSNSKIQAYYDIGMRWDYMNTVKKLEKSLKELLENSKVQHKIIEKILKDIRSDKKEETKETQKEEKEEEQPVEPEYRTSCFCLETKKNRGMLIEF